MISRSRQGWRDLVQRVLKNDINCNRLIDEYYLEERERVYRVHRSSLLCLPSEGLIEWQVLPIASIVCDLTRDNEQALTRLVPAFEQTKSINSKRVTSNRLIRL